MMITIEILQIFNSQLNFGLRISRIITLFNEVCAATVFLEIDHIKGSTASLNVSWHTLYTKFRIPFHL